MGVTTAGMNQALGLAIGEAITPFNSANAYLAVGGGTGATTAFANTQTDLQGASKTRKAMDATYPTRAGNVLTFRATFGTADANYTWDEFAVFNASTAGVMLMRNVTPLGTKTSAESKVFTATETVTV